MLKSALETTEVEVVSKEPLTSKVFALRIKLIKPVSMDFIAGQFITFVLGGMKRRAYSVISTPAVSGASADQEQVLDFWVDVSANGLGSQFVTELEPGKRFEIQGPFGQFTTKSHDRAVVLVCTGVGVAPFKSIIDNVIQESSNGGKKRDIILIFGVRAEENIFYFDYFEKLATENSNFHFFPMLSQPAGEWKGRVGRVTQFLEENFDLTAGKMVYICGRPEMVKDVRALLAQKGFPIQDVRVEVF